MNNDLTKTFFDTFGIEPKQTCGRMGVCNNYVNYNDCNGCNSYKYPQITDRILLELICILNPYSYPSGENIQHLKEGVLKWCIKFKNDIKQQVQALFKEGKKC